MVLMPQLVRAVNEVKFFILLVLECMERVGFLACVAVSSPHGKHSCTDAHCMKVNAESPCWIAKSKSGGKP